MMYRFKVWLRWRRQGRPRDFPVVMRAGTLTIEDGEPHITGWYFEGRHMTRAFMTYYADGTDSSGELWDYLVERYPVTVEPTRRGA